MALSLSTILTAVRDRHPTFDRTRVPNAVLARSLTDYQRQLVMRGLGRNKQYLVQTAPIAIGIDPDNNLETQGAGGPGQSAALEGPLGEASVAERPAGLAIELDTSEVLVDDSVASGGSMNTLERSTAGWTVDAYAGKIVLIIRGAGAGQRRDIGSNTADTLTLTQDWAEVPIAGNTIFRIVDSMPSTNVMGVVSNFPQVEDHYGYLVKLHDDGTPYIDLSVPLVARVGVGVPLPPHHLIVGGTVYDNQGEDWDLTIQSYGRRTEIDSDFPVMIVNGQLRLLGGFECWRLARSIELLYVPIPPALPRLDSLFILPDSAYSVLVAGAAYISALRVSAHPDVRISETDFATDLVRAEGAWFSQLTQMRKAARHVKRG